MVKQIHFKLSVDELTFDEMIAIQEGNLKEAKRILVKLATNEDGIRLPEDEANALIGGLTIPQMRATFEDFGEQIALEMKATLPNGRGRR